MSEDFLTRWSRRKHDAVETEQAKSAPGERDTIAEDAILENATPVEPVEAIEPATPPVFDIKSLPPIESITAATDIRPFLAPGVPLEIARAALRRAWSADPRIRDFVGLADYDWDFHTPGSAAGFGPLEMTDELRRMVARIVGEIVDSDAPDRAGEPATGTECVEESPALGAEAKRVAAPGGDVQQLDLPVDRVESVVVVETTASAALQHETSPDQAARSPIRRGHGRALPK
jgi:hypothetical protein